MSQKEEPPKKTSITQEVIANAEKIIGLSFTDSERKLMEKKANERLADYEKIRAITIDNSIPPPSSSTLTSAESLKSESQRSPSSK